MSQSLDALIVSGESSFQFTEIVDSLLSSVATMPTAVRAAPAVQRLSMFERGCLGLAVIEIPLQLDKYFLYRIQDAEQGAVAGLNLSIATLCIGVLYVCWLAETATHRIRSNRAFVFGIPMLAYMAFMGLSIFSAQIPILSVFDLALVLQAYALFFYIANRVRSKADIVFCVAVLGIMMLVQSFIIFGLVALGDAALGREYSLGPLLLSVWPDGRPAGSMHSPVLAGAVLAIAWTPVMTLTLCRTTRSIQVLAVSATLMGMLAILLTQTRGAILTALVGAGLIGTGMLLRAWLPRWILFACLGLAIVGAYPLYRVVQKRVIHGDDGSAVSRVHLSAIAMQMIEERPWFGHGSGNGHLAGQRFANAGKYRSEWYYTTHCKYLLVWVENGILGLLAFLAMLASGLRYGVSAWTRGDRLLAPLGLALAAAIAGHMVHMAVDIFNSRTTVQMLWVVLGVTTAVGRVSQLRDFPVAGFPSCRPSRRCTKEAS